MYGMIVVFPAIKKNYRIQAARRRLAHSTQECASTPTRFRKAGGALPPAPTRFRKAGGALPPALGIDSACLTETDGGGWACLVGRSGGVWRQCPAKLRGCTTSASFGGARGRCTTNASFGGAPGLAKAMLLVRSDRPKLDWQVLH